MANFGDYTKRFGLLFFVFLFLLTSAGLTFFAIWQNRQQNKVEEETQAQTLNQEDKLTTRTLDDFNPIGEVTEIQKLDRVIGTGEEANVSSTITAHYTGAYAVNGEIFESSKDSGQPATFPLSGVITGWQEGVPGMKVGGVRRLIIPGSKAYGDAPAGYVPGSTDRPLGPLVFDIELISIEK